MKDTILLLSVFPTFTVKKETLLRKNVRSWSYENSLGLGNCGNQAVRNQLIWKPGCKRSADMETRSCQCNPAAFFISDK